MVLTDVDDLTLWSSCRRVSRAFRAEAERLFMTERLQKLHIRWDGSGSMRAHGEEVLYTFFATTKALQPIDSLRATFSVNMQYRSQDPSLAAIGIHRIIELLPPYPVIHPILSNSDRTFAARLGKTPSRSQVCQLGPYFSDVPLSNIEINPYGKKVSFDWKRFLDSFYGVWAEARDLAHKKNFNYLDPGAAEEALLRKFSGRKTISLHEREVWVRSYGIAAGCGAFEEAYVRRLLRFHTHEGIICEPNVDCRRSGYDQKAWKELMDYCMGLWWMRNEFLFGKFMKEHGIGHPGMMS